MGKVDDAVKEYIQDLKDRNEHQLAGQIEDSYEEVQQPKAQAVVDAILEDGLDAREVINLFVMSILK